MIIATDELKITPIVKKEVKFKRYDLNGIGTGYIKENLIKHNNSKSLFIYNAIIKRLEV